MNLLSNVVMNPNYLLVEAPSKVIKSKKAGEPDIVLLNTNINTSTQLKVIKISEFADSSMNICVGDHVLTEGTLEKININDTEYMVVGLHSVIMCLKNTNPNHDAEVPELTDNEWRKNNRDADHCVVLTPTLIFKDTTDISEFPNRSISSPALDMQRGY